MLQIEFVVEFVAGNSASFRTASVKDDDDEDADDDHDVDDDGDVDDVDDIISKLASLSM